MIEPVGGKTWVGLPLAVHRRCDRPMFDLANRIAYDGAMVYGTIAPGLDKETPVSLATGWIDTRGVVGRHEPAGEETRLVLVVPRPDIIASEFASSRNRLDHRRLLAPPETTAPAARRPASGARDGFSRSRAIQREMADRRPRARYAPPIKQKSTYFSAMDAIILIDPPAVSASSGSPRSGRY
ncbi:hypothetical protein [Sphingomonas sp. CL5.1]|uniref:hypothetical protein n=1 Tax=Sphingomonas sp. CL5.1 TaxID=2653203 RepID=UPI001C2E8583|nr:hypothetical protein [Sphingomonas sp. CL5.1]